MSTIRLPFVDLSKEVGLKKFALNGQINNQQNFEACVIFRMKFQVSLSDNVTGAALTPG